MTSWTGLEAYPKGVVGAWWGPAKQAAGWLVKTAPTWGPTAKRSASGVNERLANREKAISHATQIGAQFAEVWLRDRRYWIVRKDGEIINTFPNCDDSAALEAAAARVRDEAWKTPDTLFRRRARERTRNLRRKPPQAGREP
jgi:hypothetical protein